MPASFRVPMSTTPREILNGRGRGLTAFLRNVGTGSVFLGDETVTATTGFELNGNTTIGPLKARSGRHVWGVRASGTSIVHALVIGEGV